jgi:UDP:flavonoid glycosyltransferase YjiC (YdhE family)
MPSAWTPPEELRRFLDDGPPPVFVGLGSTNPGDAERISRTVTAALRQAGPRGVIQAGLADLSTSDDDMLAIGDVPHEWLFPRTAAVVHAAGAGTTAAGLRAGVPAVPIPVSHLSDSINVFLTCGNEVRDNKTASTNAVTRLLTASTENR